MPGCGQIFALVASGKRNYGTASGSQGTMMARADQPSLASNPARRTGGAAFSAMLLALTACSAPDEAELVEEADEVPAAEIVETPLEDPAAFDPDIGRQAFQAAMRTGCPGAAVAGAECRATEDPTQFVCEYELIDDARGERLEATIARDGEEWVLAEMPAHCATAGLEADLAD